MWKSVKEEVSLYRQALEKQEDKGKKDGPVDNAENRDEHENTQRDELFEDAIIIAEGTEVTNNIFTDEEFNYPLELDLPVHNLDDIVFQPSETLKSQLPESNPFANPVPQTSFADPSTFYRPDLSPLPVSKNVSPTTHTSVSLQSIPSTSLSNNLHAPANASPCVSASLAKNLPLISTSSTPNTSPTLTTKQPSDLSVTPTKQCTPSPSEIKSKISTPFKNALFWPNENQSKIKKSQTKRVKLPSAITSDEWKNYYLKKEDEKKKALMEKERRKQAREMKQHQLIKDKENKKKGTKRRKLFEDDPEDDVDDVDIPEVLSVQAEEPLPLNLSDLRPSQWVVVPYCLNGEKKPFVGQIISVGDGEDNRTVTVKYLEKKLTSEKKFMWPKTDDIDTISPQEIIRLLREPTFDRWGYLTFEDF